MKELKCVAHDLAHQSQSGLSWLHPHLAEACRLAGVREPSFELLVPEPYPQGVPRLEALRLAPKGLQTWFTELVARLGHDKEKLSSVLLRFQFGTADNYNSAVEVTISTSTGKRYGGQVDYI